MTGKERRSGIIWGLIFIGLGIAAAVNPDLMEGAEPSGRHYLLKQTVVWLWSRPGGVVAILVGTALLWRVFKSKSKDKFHSAESASSGHSATANPVPTEGQANMTSPEDFISAIPGIADDHIKRCGEIFKENVDYSEESIMRIDDLINKGWPDGPPAMLETTVITFGSYLGEAIRKNLGGQWGYSEEEGYFLENVGGRAKIFPFAKMAKRFTQGEDESISFYYAGTKRIIEQGRPSPK